MENIHKSGKVYPIYVFVWVGILLNIECQIVATSCPAEVSCEKLGANIAKSVRPDWVSIASTTTSVYFFSRGTCKVANWENARSVCINLGGNLVVPTKNNINKEISGVVRERGLYHPWIGLSRVGGQFLTIHGVKPIFTKWAVNQPNHLGTQNCVRFWRDYRDTGEGEWDNRECHIRRDFICEKPATTTARPTLDPNSQKISELSKKPVNSANVHNVSEEIKKLTSSATDLISDDIINTASVLEKIVNVTGTDDEITNNVLKTIENVLDARLDVIVTAQDEKNSSTRILELITKLLEKGNESFKKTFSNFAVEVSTYKPDYPNNVTFPTVSDDKSGNSNNTTENAESSPQRSTSTSIRLPPTVFRNNGSNNISSPETVIFVLYEETKLFHVNPSRPLNYTKHLNSYVISASIKGRRKVSNLTDPVVLYFVSLKHGEKKNASCSYWDFSQLRWSEEGCEFKGVREDGRIICHCNHLTNFAMLMDIYPQRDQSEVLGIISYIGCTVSLIALLLTIITILLFSDLRSKAPIKILLNFCISLSLTLVVFLSAAERSKTSSLASCRVAAIAMHYFILVVFMWTAVEAFNMYLLFVKIIPSYFPKFMLKCCLMAWGIPVVIVLITVGVAHEEYGDTKYCRLQGTPFLVSFLTPILIIILGNSIAFVFILHSLLTSRNEITTVQKVKGWVQTRRAAAIFVLLGLSWVFGVFAVDDAKQTFQYLFCIFNSLQGLLVFVFYCILQPSTRTNYRNFLKRATRKKPNTEAASPPTGDSNGAYINGVFTESNVSIQASNSTRDSVISRQSEETTKYSCVMTETITESHTLQVTVHLDDQSKKAAALAK